MFKYIYWLFVLAMVVIRKVVGLIMVWTAIPFRSYGRNTIYSYHLENDIFLKRLWERRPIRMSKKLWKLTMTPHPIEYGDIGDRYIKTRRVSTAEYYLVLWLIWGWLDDDANEDTYDKGFNLTIINKTRKEWMPGFIVDSLKTAVEEAEACPIKGNSFDLGDGRSKYPLFNFWSTFWWTNRNTGYNFNYRFHEISDKSLVWSKEYKGGLIGWRPGTIVNGVQTYNFEIWKK